MNRITIEYSDKEKLLEILRKFHTTKEEEKYYTHIQQNQIKEGLEKTTFKNFDAETKEEKQKIILTI